jgi:hypothetical protein
MSKVLSILVVLVGLALAVSPWVLRFRADRVAAIDVLVGGIVVVVLGALLHWTVTATPAHRPQH